MRNTAPQPHFGMELLCSLSRMPKRVWDLASELGGDPNRAKSAMRRAANQHGLAVIIEEYETELTARVPDLAKSQHDDVCLDYWRRVHGY